MEGKYKIGAEHIRSLAITCHALDSQFDGLFNSETICGPSERTKDAYERLLSETLINLAIAIRVSPLSKEPEYTDGFGGPCGLFDANRSMTIKDVCDKIIHADSIRKPIEPGTRFGCIELRGTHFGKQWDFGLGLTIFSEYLLLLLDRVEDRSE